MKAILAATMLTLGVLGAVSTASATEDGYHRAYPAVAADHGFAKKAKKRHRGHVGYVTAYSYYGNNSLTAPVRVDRSRGFASKQIRLPGGVWIDCAGSCAETLRVEKVDFWEQFSNGGGRKR